MAHALLCLWLMIGLLGASCYTGPVNERPTITIWPVGTFSRGDSPTYMATAEDPDGPLPSVWWVATKEICKTPAEIKRSANWPQKGWTKDEGMGFAVPAEVTVAKFCVWAKATDQYGAVAIAALPGDPDNHAPVAKLRRTPSSSAVPLRTLITFTTESTDPDGDNLQTIGWRIDGHPELAFLPCPGGDAADGSNHCFMPEAAGDYTIEASVTDGMKTTPVTSSVVVQPGHVPIARLELEAPLKADSYPLGTTFHLSGAKSSDDDPSDLLDPTWEKVYRLEAPSLSRELDDCDGMFSPLERCFRADVAGTYHVSLKVSDGTSVSVPEVLDLKVLPDTPPCLKVTEPAMSDSIVPGRLDPLTPVKVFKVLRVEDDQDPYPRAQGSDDQTRFSWSVDSGTGFKPVWRDDPQFPLSTEGYSQGQEVSVRLEIRDRVTSETQLQPCTTDICRTSDTCVQRTTWKVKFVL